MMDMIPTHHLTHWGLVMRMVVMIPTRHLTYWGLVTHIWSEWYQPVTQPIEAWWRIYGRDDTNPSLNPLRPGDVCICGRDDTNLSLNTLRPGDGYNTHSSFNSLRPDDAYGWDYTNPSLNPLRPDDAYIVWITQTSNLSHWDLVTHIWCVWYQLVV